MNSHPFTIFKDFKPPPFIMRGLPTMKQHLTFNWQRNLKGPNPGVLQRHNLVSWLGIMMSKNDSSPSPRKFKRGIGSLFDPVLTLWGGSHIGSSRMEQSYCTSGFFRQRVIVTTNRGQSAEVSSRMVSAKTHVATKCVAACVMFF